MLGEVKKCPGEKVSREEPNKGGGPDGTHTWFKTMDGL